ncbi:hypothetical protein DL95DRAFT_396230 [Leptodontidium sp. 2 PMI_412]|nr:hypothetical protein DL95DRAFT_396230 [Leptodontidium sp. 2 PMI_412]
MVTSYIRDNRYRLPVYMITGLKVAKGFRVTRRHRRGESASSSERIVFRASSDCVFAFQLSRIRMKKNGTVQERDYTQGALLHTDDTEILEEDQLLDATWEVNEDWEFLADIPDMVTHLAVDTESEVGCLVAAPMS